MKRGTSRSCVLEFVSAWIAGDYDTMSEVCTSDVRWWTPVSGEPVTGPADTRAELQRVIGPVPLPIEVTAVVVDEDGTRCVLEMRAAAGPEDTPSFVTSILTLRDGLVSTGRTYVATTARDHTDAVTS